MRKPRLEYPGALFHVIARGNQRQKVFLEDGDYVRYLRLLGDPLEGRGFILYAYCLMGNHVHLLIEQTTEFPLSRYMQRLQSAYTAFFNHKYDKTGHLFQGRYKAILVDKDSYLVSLVRYIHLNPYRAKIESRLGEYPWSSHRQYLGRDKEPLAKVSAERVLSLFSRMKVLARKAYERFMKEEVGKGEKVRLYDLRDGRILGGEEFEKEAFKIGKMTIEEGRLKIKKTLGEVWNGLMKRERMAEEPKGWTRSRLMGEAAYVMCEWGGMKQKEVAEMFKIDPTAINRAVKRLEERWKKGDGSREKLMKWARGG
jgi:putative transposase